MSKGKTIRVYDYVNHPYEVVRNKLSENALGVFRQATKIAALRAKTVAAELHLNFAGIEIATDIDIDIKSIETQPKQGLTPETTRIILEWKASRMPRLFPFMQAELSVYPLTSTETQLSLAGNYEPPMGVLGGLIDAVVGHHIAEASVHQFMTDTAVHLRNELGPA